MADTRRAFFARIAVAGALALAGSCAPSEEEGAREQSLSASIAPRTAHASASAPRGSSAASTSPPATSPSAASTAAASKPSSSARLVGTERRHDELLRQLAGASIRSHRPVGTSSMVFRCELSVPLTAAFKLATRERPFAPQNEVAAYRLSRLLGLNNVPPAVPRRVEALPLRAAIEPAFLPRWPELLSRLRFTGDGGIDAAAIYWIDGLRELGLERGHARERVTTWLRFGASAPEDKRPLVPQLSTLFAFDYLIGNWDRWSGGNVQGDASGALLYMRDNDAGFATRLREGLQRRLLAPLLETQVYSRSFVLAVRDLRRDQFEQALRGEGELGGPVRLDPRAIEGLFDRRAAFLSHVSALIEQHSEARVLAYP